MSTTQALSSTSISTASSSILNLALQVTTVDVEITSTDDSSSTDATDILSFGICNSTTFTSTEKKTAQIMMYAGSGWVIGWILFTILINIRYQVVTVERFLDFLQEAGLIVAFVFMGFFVLRPNWSDMCRVTEIVLHASMVFVMTSAVMQAIFSMSLNQGCLRRTSGCLAVIYYVFPVVFTASFTSAVYFPLKSQYDNNKVHCFAEIYTKMFWTFSVPFGALLVAAVFFNQIGVTACNIYKLDADKDQLFWAKRTARDLPILLLWFGFCFFTLLFAVDMQLIWLVGVYVGLCTIFGPMIFIFHTYCYRKSRTALWQTHLIFYRPCIEPLTDELDRKASLNATIMTPTFVEQMEFIPQPEVGMPVMSPPAEFAVMNSSPVMLEADASHDNYIDLRPSMPVVSNNEDGTDTSAEDFYNWVTHKDNIRAENVLFKKNE